MEVQQPPQQRRRSSRREENRRRRQEQQPQNQPNQPNPDSQIAMVVEQDQPAIVIPQPNPVEQPQQQLEIDINRPQQQVHQPQIHQPEEQKEPQVQNLAPQRFLAKIPNTKVLREFLVNTGGYYAPPLRELTNDFCRKLLAGQKKLLKMKDVIFVDQVPNWPEFSSKRLWAKAKDDPGISIYFPDFSNSRLPQRKYLLNVANTVSKNSVVNAVIDIRKKRELQAIDQQPIVVTNEFVSLLSQFIPISVDQKRRGLRLTKKKEYDQCNLCLQPMIKSNTIANFACLRHRSHRKCIAKYMTSDHAKKTKYLCPQRCSQAWNR